MNILQNNIVYILFTMDVECPGHGSSEAGFNDWSIGEKAVRGFVDILGAEGWPATLFIVPEAARRYSKVLREVNGRGVELGLHVHPQDLGYEEQFGAFSFEKQLEILNLATDIWSNALGQRPYSFRPGNFSANDATFPALTAANFLQGSISSPERRMVSLRAVWTGAPKDPHWAHPANRLLPGNSRFLEVPVSIDWESMIWGGLAPLELRVESVDSRAHGFTIQKNFRRLRLEDVPVKTLVPITHNYFDYTSDAEFRTTTLKGVIEGIKRFAGEYHLQPRGVTLADFRRVFEIQSSALDSFPKKQDGTTTLTNHCE
jgi:peptidoglycan/xylan/chitin deacetylase (PgdA/CDA1 family)